MGQNSMMCPRCEIPMNHHAEKIVEPRGEGEAQGSTGPFDGAIEEFHTCPRCGAVGARPGA